MGNYWFKFGIILFALMLVVFISPIISFAGGGGFKERFQQKISQSTINFQGNLKDEDQINRGQYEPYYMENEEQVQKPADGRQSMPQNQAANMAIPQTANMLASREREIDNFTSVVSSYAIYQTDYKAELEENVVTVNGKIIFEVFRKGWTRLPLVKSSVGLINVSVNKGTAFVITQADKYYLMVDKPGNYPGELTLSESTCTT